MYIYFKNNIYYLYTILLLYCLLAIFKFFFFFLGINHFKGIFSEIKKISKLYC